MAGSRLRRTIIQTAVKRGIQDIGENPKRGLRNLVDLGDLYAREALPRQMFARAKKLLSDPKSPYFDIASRLVHTVDSANLSSFSINIVFSCWSSGARDIRRAEVWRGFNIPWAIVMELSNDADDGGLGMLNTLMQQAKSLGIYCYIIYVRPDYRNLDDLLLLLNDYPDCAHILLLQGSQLHAGNIDYVHAVSNLFVAVDVTSDSAGEALDLLSKRKCFFGGVSPYSSDDESFDPDRVLRQSDEAGIPIVLFAQQDFQTAGAVSCAQIQDAQRNNNHPVLALDLFYDIAYADGAISSESCMVFVNSLGEMMLVNYDKGITAKGYRLSETRLDQIFRFALPKR